MPVSIQHESENVFRVRISGVLRQAAVQIYPPAEGARARAWLLAGC